jgi:hypothetical protein
MTYLLYGWHAIAVCALQLACLRDFCNLHAIIFSASNLARYCYLYFLLSLLYALSALWSLSLLYATAISTLCYRYICFLLPLSLLYATVISALNYGYLCSMLPLSLLNVTTISALYATAISALCYRYLCSMLPLTLLCTWLIVTKGCLGGKGQGLVSCPTTTARKWLDAATTTDTSGIRKASPNLQGAGQGVVGPSHRTPHGLALAGQYEVLHVDHGRKYSMNLSPARNLSAGMWSSSHVICTRNSCTCVQ